jgi:hypothetical protein
MKVMCSLTSWTTVGFLHRRALPGGSGHEDIHTQHDRLPHLHRDFQSCFTMKGRRQSKRSAATAWGLGFRLTAAWMLEDRANRRAKVVDVVL